MNQCRYGAGRGGHRHRQITIQTEVITHAKNTSQIYSLFNTSGGFIYKSPAAQEGSAYKHSKTSSCHCCSHGCRGTLPNFKQLQPDHTAWRVPKKVRQPSGRSVPSSPHVHPLGKLFSRENRAGGSWAGGGAVEGFTKHAAHAFACEQRQHQ